MADITKAEADRLVAEPKIITGNIHWTRVGRSYRISDVVVLAVESGEVLKLRGYVGPSNRSIVLLVKNLPIRKWTVHPRSRFPDGSILEGPHKHSWDDELRDEFTYIPDDMRIGNPNEELLDFLKECNIELLGQYQQEMFFPY